MIKLKNVSKYYYSKGVIATGFTKVNLEFNIGEFVAITGESGSGKSTLLNVISGLDSYEEGEMYVNGKETSHYMEKDWEIYRRKYIGNIYQNFNLINSYSVYQNIDLILSLNGVPRKLRKSKINELLARVNMTRYKHTKVSKLSGGQKQRVAIARALAKDVPVIIADEPTGNLDKAAAISVIKLLKEISKDKLIIIVTHNYDQVEDYVTRKITMHDGRVLEDKKLMDVSNDDNLIKTASLKNINILEKVRLGIRNTFNIVPKFILLLLVYSFIVCALMAEYSYFRLNEEDIEKLGYNNLFYDTNPSRIIINKNDKTTFSDDEINKIKSIKNVESISTNAVGDDIIFQYSNDNDIWINCLLKPIDNFKGKVDVGRVPEKDNEVIVVGSKSILTSPDKILNKDLYTDYDNGKLDKSTGIKIVGIKYSDNTSSFKYTDSIIYASNNYINNMTYLTNKNYSEIKLKFMGTNYKIGSDNNFKIDTNDWVSPGKAFISSSLNSYCDKEKCIGRDFDINIKNIYFESNKSFNIEKVYDSKNINKILNLPDYNKDNFNEYYDFTFYINPNDYRDLFNKGTYEISVYANDIKNVDNISKKLNSMNYHTLNIKDTLVRDDRVKIIRVIKIIVTCILIVVLFFISYFIIKLILKSRNSYFAILRMLGANISVCRNLLVLELFNVASIAYFIFLLLAKMNENKIITVKFINIVNRYFTFNDYLTLYLIIILMSLFISLRYASTLFKKSVMNTYREEA